MVACVDEMPIAYCKAVPGTGAPAGRRCPAWLKILHDGARDRVLSRKKSAFFRDLWNKRNGL
jgi:hypothetical protein